MPDTENNIGFISTYVLPPFGDNEFLKTKNHLNHISQLINTKEMPFIVSGDFNLVYWSNEIKSFRNSSNLNNSRRDVSQNLLKIPYEHIFFSNKLECVLFEEIKDDTGGNLGIKGSYQHKLQFIEPGA